MTDDTPNKQSQTERTAFTVLAVARRLVTLTQSNSFRRIMSTLIIVLSVWLFSKNIPYFLYMNLAKMSLEYGHFDVAEEMFKDALAESGEYHSPEPRRIRTLNDLGQLYFDECRFEESVKVLDEASELQKVIHASAKERAETLLRLGLALKKLQLLPQAKDALQAALALHDENKTGTKQLAQIKLALGQVELAANDLTNADVDLNTSYTLLSQEKERGARLAKTALLARLDVAKRRSSADTVKSIEAQIGALRVPPANYSWFDFQAFGYKVTDQILRCEAAALLHPSSELHSVISDQAMSQIQRNAEKIGAEPIAGSMAPRIYVEYVELADLDQRKFIPMSVMASRTTGAHIEKFYFRYSLGCGTKTTEPMLVSFAMLGAPKPNKPSQAGQR